MAKPDIIIIVPERVRGNTNGYDFLSELAGNLSEENEKVIVIDFKDTKWFDGNLCSVLGSILDSVKLRNNSIYLRGLKTHIKTAFTKNKFLDTFGEDHIAEDSLTIPYIKVGLEDEQDIKNFFNDQLFDKPDMPQMSDLARNRVLVALFEVCVNAVTHGNCENVYVCGQIFPNKQPPEVSVTFSDMGKTIKANVNEFLQTSLSGNKTILWALEDGHTTKVKTTGGIGLKLLEALVVLNHGSLQIVSGDGFVEVLEGYNKEYQLDNSFPGTIVTIRLRLKDSNFYVLKSEIDLNDIF